MRSGVGGREVLWSCSPRRLLSFVSHLSHLLVLLGLFFCLLLRHFSPLATLCTLSAGGSRWSKARKIHQTDDVTEASWPH